MRNQIKNKINQVKSEQVECLPLFYYVRRMRKSIDQEILELIEKCHSELNKIEKEFTGKTQKIL